MAHSFSKIWLHLVFATKNREPLITRDLEKPLYDFFKQQLEGLGCPLAIVNGMPDHVHLLFRLNPKKSVSDVVKHVKGSSSYWANHQFNTTQNVLLAWQTGYGVFSVSESQANKAFGYIKKQKEHHATLSFMEEYKSFLTAHGFEWIDGEVV